MEWAYAMGVGTGTGTGSPGAPGGGGMLGALFPLLAMFLVFYFLLIRPQQKRSRQHKELLDNLKRGDEVVTTGGIHGKITGITESVITLEIADNIRIKVQRENISGLKPKVQEKSS